MARKGERLPFCQRGHVDWVWDNRGDRRCRTCANERKRLRRRKMGIKAKYKPQPRKRFNDHGETEWDTYTYTELMKARGYVA